MKYKSEKELFEVVEKFENGSMKREDWGHAEHLIVGFYYLSNNDFEKALEKMRKGIFNLLKSFEVDLTKEMPYHETLTIFWMNAINDFIKPKKDLPTLLLVTKLIKNLDKDHPLRFYSREVLFSDQARKEFVNADLL